jgi:guanosine-diphosphatase
MGGKDEGVYAWITANYLLGTIKASAPPDTPIYAVLDLGGASTQIVFEPRFASDIELREVELKYSLQFGGRSHVLYHYSYLGYRLIRGRGRVHRLVVFMSTLQGIGSRRLLW